MNSICSPQKLDERLSCMAFASRATFVSHTTFNLKEYISVNIPITNFVASFQGPFLLVALWNATYLGTFAKLLYFETQNVTFVGTSEKLLLFETQIAAFVGISKKLLLFY